MSRRRHWSRSCGEYGSGRSLFRLWPCCIPALERPAARCWWSSTNHVLNLRATKSSKLQHSGHRAISQVLPPWRQRGTELYR